MEEPSSLERAWNNAECDFFHWQLETENHSRTATGSYQASLHCREAYHDWTWSEQFKDPDADLMETAEESEDDITDHV